MSIFEALMMICFGFAWPFSIVRSFKSKSTKGKSIIFLFVVVAGYIFGIIHKLLYSLDFVIYLYGLNAIMVSLDIALYFRNRAIESKNPVC